MKIIVLHGRFNNEPIIVKTDAISMIRRYKDEGEEYSSILVEGFELDVKETIGTVITRIKKAESEVNIANDNN